MTTKEQDYLLNAGFTMEQTAKILEGKKAGLNAAIYANKAYLPMQMHQIMLGLQENLKVECYAKPEFDWFQMEEIRMGLKAGVDITVYAKPELSYEKMRQLRRGLEDNIDLCNYLYLDAPVMRELRKAKENDVDILPYIEQGYDAEQLREIRYAIMHNVDLEPYLSKEYRAASIAEIREGLEKGIDVSCYANIRYGWRQMREIRKGLEQRIDIDKYSSHMYNWLQMREIRKGLEEGLDVNTYALFRYTEDEMHKKRMALLDEITREQERILQSQIKSEDFMFEFMTDDMEVYVTILTRDKQVTRERFLQILEMNDIRKGILEEAVSKIVAGEIIKKPLLIAKGRIPHKGEDGWYEFFFRTNLQRKPMVLEDGTVDYRKIDWFEMVKAGQKLAFYHEAKEGEDGFNVRGQVLKARKGLEQRILTGQGFRLEPDRKTYISLLDGMIRLDDNYMSITSHMVIDAVNMTTGNIDFKGSVHVTGDVGYGAVVKATEDIVIDGNVESAVIECGGSVVLKKGMNSAGHGMIKAGKDVVSRFFDSVKVVAGGNIDVGKSLNSQLYAEEMILSSGTIAGGVARSGAGFKIKHVGNQAGLRTALQVKINDSVWQENVIAHKTIQEVEAELQMLNNSYEEFKLKFPPEIRENMELFKKIEKAVFTKNKQLGQLKQVQQEIEQTIMKTRSARIVINGQAHQGTTVELDGCRWTANDQYDIVIKKQDEKVEVLSK